MTGQHVETDICIIGCGLAGLVTALHLPSHYRITIISSQPLGMNASSYAQDGLAVPLAAEDSLEQHVEDTLRSGNGIANEEVVRSYLSRAEEAMAWLTQRGVQFAQRADGRLQLRQEAGHRYARTAYAGDVTGKRIMPLLCQAVLGADHIQVLTDYMAIDAVTEDQQMLAIDTLHVPSQQLCRIVAKSFVLATGGASAIYSPNTNPDVAFGDGMAIAWRAGCRLANLEFTQFHPTCLAVNAGRPLLISEAVCALGGQLTRPDGKRFMGQYDAKMELASQDIIARAIYDQMQRYRLPYVCLDISHKAKAWVRKQFPTLCRATLSYGMDLASMAISVAPAAHYSCGGIVVDGLGRTDIQGLYAVGEVACTGMHGANVLASNTLLESIIAGMNVAEQLAKTVKDLPMPVLVGAYELPMIPGPEYALTSYCMGVRKLMWDAVGMVRHSDQLAHASAVLAELQIECVEAVIPQWWNPEWVALRNLLQIASLTTQSAIGREESRGVHFSADHPSQYAIAEPTILVPEVAIEA